ncbi:hypothetical protein GCM10022416_03810 [Actinomadura keratinilytica]|uniref:Uncharacterized protein n=1 Tax=Actinomadura keratinilytica TaxID=547461 RepID=A0ABP7XZ56_9ACTN
MASVVVQRSKHDVVRSVKTLSRVRGFSAGGARAVLGWSRRRRRASRRMKFHVRGSLRPSTHANGIRGCPGPASAEHRDSTGPGAAAEAAPAGLDTFRLAF